jgi:hypothetical protein
MPDLSLPEFKLPEGLPSIPPFISGAVDPVPSEGASSAAPGNDDDDDDDDDEKELEAQEPETKSDEAGDDLEAAEPALAPGNFSFYGGVDAAVPPPKPKPALSSANAASKSSVRSDANSTWDANAVAARQSAEDPRLLALGVAGHMSPSQVEAVAYKFNECAEALGTPELSKPAFKMLVGRGNP